VCPALPEVPDGVLTAGNASQVRPARRPAPAALPQGCPTVPTASLLHRSAGSPGRLAALGTLDRHLYLSCT